VLVDRDVGMHGENKSRCNRNKRQRRVVGAATSEMFSLQHRFSNQHQ